MLNYAKPGGIRQWAQIYRLYRSAFPAGEKKPFSVILKMHQKGVTDVWHFTRDGKFVGLIMTVNGDDLILIDYLAVEERRRGMGIGSEILALMKEHYRGKGVFLEIESAYEECADREQRLRRKRFYEKCGFQSMDVFVWLFGVKMELMGFGCGLSYAQYRAFYRDHYSPWAADHIKSAKK